jgi:proline dehydrogenase
MTKLLFIFAGRFIAGRTIEETIVVLRRLKAQGFLTTIDHLGENVTNADEAKQATDVYIEIIRTLKKNNLDNNVSVKLTQLGLDISRELCLENLKRITEVAKETGGFIRVDIEGSKYTTATFDVVKELKEMGMPVGAAVQAMLRRTPQDMVEFLEQGITMRICKGAYKEPIDIAFGKKEEVDRQYVALTKRLLTSGLYHGIATHDERMIAETKAFAKERKIKRDSFEFQMLFGIRPSFQEQTIANGWRLRVYVPFGRAWLPYVVRRLRERKENIWFVVKNLFRR